MEFCNLYLVFETPEKSKVKLKIQDVRPDITAAEVEALGKKIVEKDALLISKKTLAFYLNSELEKTTVEIL